MFRGAHFFNCGHSVVSMNALFLTVNDTDSKQYDDDDDDDDE